MAKTALFLLIWLTVICPLDARAAKAPAGGESKEQVYVQVKSTKLRSQPRYLATGSTTLAYGDSVVLLESTDGWVKARSRNGKEGYLPVSAVTASKIVLKGSGDRSLAEADQSDVVLAGKGFSPEVERQLAAGNSDLNFRAVNEMERLRVGEKDLSAFLSAGKLKN